MGLKIFEKKIAVTHAGSTAAAAATNIWTPLGTNFIRLLRYRIILSGNITAGAAAFAVSLADVTPAGVATVIASTTVNLAVPVAALASLNRGAWYDSGEIDLGTGYKTAAVGNSLAINLSEVLTAGLVTCILRGIEAPWC